MVNATIKTASNCRWGPNTSYYLLDSSSSLAYEEPVQILWQEGNFYYIQYSTSNGTKRMYYPINYIENISGTVPVKTLNPDVRYVTAATSVKYSPLSTAPSAGSLGKLENVSLLIDSSTDDPVEVGNYFFIEYSTSNTSSNNTVYRKRAWINKSYLRTAPNVTNPSVVYADTDGITTAQMNANARYIFAYLTALGFSAQAACGILGNMQQESTINPGMWQDYNNTNLGYGLVQWSSYGRFFDYAMHTDVISSATATALNTLAANNPKKLMNAELECLIWCCASVGDFFPPGNAASMSFSEYATSTKSAAELAKIFHDYYERSSDSSSVIQRRQNYAEDWYDQLA